MSNDKCLWCEKRGEGVWLGACAKCAAEIQLNGMQFSGSARFLEWDGMTGEEILKAWAMLGDPNLLSDEKNNKNPGGRAGCDQAECSEE